jgi:hypothetical protein
MKSRPAKPTTASPSPPNASGPPHRRGRGRQRVHRLPRPLRAALLKGTRRALDLEQAALGIRDDQGEPLTERLLWGRVSAWRPSSYGTDPIGLELGGDFFTPVPEYARPVRERWLAGPPDIPGAWAGLDTRCRWAWLGLVHERACAGAPTMTGRWVTPTNSAVFVGTPEVHALQGLFDNGEQHGPRHPGDQQPRPGTENAQLRLVAVLYVQGQAHPCAVVPRDITALHAGSVDGGCGAPRPQSRIRSTRSAKPQGGRRSSPPLAA